MLGAATLAAVLVGCGSDQSAADPSSVAPGATATASLSRSDDALPLIERLRRGGYSVVVRHALTDRTQADDLDAITRTGKDDDCSVQRNLSSAGREQASAIGVAIERLALSRRTVIASPYCRATETAALAFGAYRVNEALSLTPFTGRDTTEAAAAALRSLLATMPPAGSNFIYVTHSPGMVGVGLPDVGEGDSVVIRPDGTGWTVVEQIKADDWQGFR